MDAGAPGNSPRESVCPAESPGERWIQLLDELGRRRFTNILVEGGSGVLGSLLDAGEIDEVHAFVAPRLAGGGAAPSPIGGLGVARMDAAWQLEDPQWTDLEGDLYVRGRVAKPSEPHADSTPREAR